MVMGARKAFLENMTSETRERWSNLIYTGCDGCPGSGERWVRDGSLNASVVLPPSAGRALEMLANALKTSQQPPERTALAPRPLPELDRLIAKGRQKQMSSK
jgi:hypothetical protein